MSFSFPLWFDFAVVEYNEQRSVHSPVELFGHHIIIVVVISGWELCIHRVATSPTNLHV